MEAIFLSLGSNLGRRRQHLEEALEGLRQCGLDIVACSSIYESEALGTVAQPDFLNLACQVRTVLEPMPLLECCLALESAMGRVRRIEKGPRPIDIDLLYYGQRVLELPGLSLPHPRLRERNFVLVPLEEIAPRFLDPQTGHDVRHLRRHCPDRSRVRRLPG